jgi:hypothetical protein
MLLEVYQILDHTHLMLFNIALFQVFQFIARELWAFITVFEFCLFMFAAGFEPTLHTIAAFVDAIAQTPPAWVFFPQVCLADSAEDAARCNQFYGKTHFDPSPPASVNDLHTCRKPTHMTAGRLRYERYQGIYE